MSNKKYTIHCKQLLDNIKYIRYNASEIYNELYDCEKGERTMYKNF